MTWSYSKKAISIIKKKTSKVGVFSCLNCFHSFRTENKHESM